MGVNTNTGSGGSTTDDSPTGVTITGTTGNDVLTIDTNTISVWAGTGTDTVVFSGDYADYTYGQSDSFVPFVKHASTGNTVSLYDVEEVEFNGVLYDLSNNGNGEFRINTETIDDQSSPNVINLSSGGFLVTWTSYNQDGSSDGVYAQRYDSHGNAINVEFKVNSYTSGNQSNPNATQLTDGSIVIAWDSSNQDGSSNGVYAKRYDAEGQAIFGSEFLVNTTIDGNQSNPNVVSLGGGGFIIAWEGSGSGDSNGIYAQRFDSNGSVNGGEFRVNNQSIQSQSSSEIISIGGSDAFAIVWYSNHEINARLHDVEYGTIFAGDEFWVGSYPYSGQYSPGIASLASDGFVVVWQSDGQDGDESGIFAQRYDASGNTVGGEFQVNTYALGYQGKASVSGLVNGGFVVSWQSYNQDGSGYGIYAQQYNADGTTSGDEFQINTYTQYTQSNSSITSLSDGGFVVSWQSYNQDGVGNGVYSQRYDSTGNRLGEATLVALDKIIGTANDDNLQGNDGVDHISTLGGADVVYAEMGEDIITLAADGVWGGSYVAENMSYEVWVGTGEKVVLTGYNQFNDVVYGGGDVDTIVLTDGSDAFFLDNIYTAHHSSLTLSSTARGIDSTARVEDVEVIYAGEGNDIVDLTSDSFNLIEIIAINGEEGDDILWGSTGIDTINGGAGDDIINGGAGSDVLTGGSGADEFQFTASSAADIITDFNITEDSIKLYYRAEDKHTYDDINILNGVLSWDANDYFLELTTSVSIDLSTRIVSSDLSNIPDLSITFVEIA